MPHQVELVYDFADDAVTPQTVYEQLSHIEYEDGYPFDEDLVTSAAVRDSDIITVSLNRTGTVPTNVSLDLTIGVTATEDGYIQVNAGSDIDAPGVPPLEEPEIKLLKKACGSSLNELSSYETVATLFHGDNGN